MKDQDSLLEIANLADELCEPSTHIEQVYGWTKGRNKRLIRTHETVLPGLIAQLRAAVRGHTTTDDQGRRVIPSSRPPLLIEALSKLVDIEVGVNEWVHIARIPHRGTVEHNIRALVGVAEQLNTKALLGELRRWRGWAAVMSGWQLPPYQPDVRCPNEDCGELGTIRIILERKTGLCVACETRWDDRDGSINLLARYISAVTETDRERVPIGSTVAGHGGWDGRRTP